MKTKRKGRHLIVETDPSRRIREMNAAAKQMEELNKSLASTTLEAEMRKNKAPGSKK